ncbi:hypothetical protein ATANTOWER_021115, partial [Ataeniobius toweri]|nr:hypothetical protein [Ataeniobius toweri]
GGASGPQTPPTTEAREAVRHVIDSAWRICLLSCLNEFMVLHRRLRGCFREQRVEKPSSPPPVWQFAGRNPTLLRGLLLNGWNMMITTSTKEVR